MGLKDGFGPLRGGYPMCVCGGTHLGPQYQVLAACFMAEKSPVLFL